MKLLLVAMANSVHVARWLGQLEGAGWDLHLVPSIGGVAPHPAIAGVTLHAATLVPGDPLAQARHLARTIDDVRPDLVHSIELQHAGYLTLAARDLVAGPFPRWMVTNWGADIHLFGRLSAHRPRIRAILERCQYYSSETARDVRLARCHGFRGRCWPVLPNSGGIDLERCAPWRQMPPASRRTIVVKGYQGTMGRALVALAAVERCADLLREYRIAVYSGQSQDVELAVDLLREHAGLNIRCLPPSTHDDMLRLFGGARAYLGLSISDGASTSMLEAIAMGALPIQSHTAAADEWLVHGHTGFIVPPEDPAAVAAALEEAITNDALVNEAAGRNATLAASRLDHRRIRPQVQRLYEQTVRDEPFTEVAAPDLDEPLAGAGSVAAGSVPREPYRLDAVRRVAIFGAGSNRDAARELSTRCGWHVAYFVDNNPSTWGWTLDGAEVRAPTRLHDDPVDLVIVASDAHRRPLMDQLESMGFEPGVTQIWFRSAVQIGATCVQVR